MRRRESYDNKRATKPTHKPKHHQKKIDIRSSETIIEPITKDNFIISYSLPLEQILSYLDSQSLSSYLGAINKHHHLVKILDDRLGVYSLIYPWVSETRVLPSADGTCNKELFEVNRWREKVSCNLPSSVTSTCMCDSCTRWKQPKNCQTEEQPPEIFIITQTPRPHQKMILVKTP